MGWLFGVRWVWWVILGLCLWWLLWLCMSALETGFGVLLWLTCSRVFFLVASIYNVLVADEIRKDLQMVISGEVQSGQSIDVK
jgi:hypothetical protein